MEPHQTSAANSKPQSIIRLVRLVFGPLLALVFAVTGALFAAQTPRSNDRSVAPLSPEQQRSTFRLDDSISIELVAAEPDVVDPVAVSWDEDGRMYVTEMGDYPTGPPGGRIKLLEDRDGDGAFERVTVFADKLPFPTSAVPWSGGLIVTAAPDILYLKDTDGDGSADERTVLFSGFTEGNQQLRVNSLILGIDNWFYAANGRSDGTIQRAAMLPNRKSHRPEGASIASSQQPVSIRQRDFRFDTRSNGYESVSGFTQHGHGFDDWGHRFIGWNTMHIRHAVLDQRYLNRATTLVTGVEEISDHGSAARIFPISKTTQRFNIEPAGFVNASCGLTIYRGDLLGPEYHGNAFVCEPLSNVVHRDVLEQAGATFVARRASNEQEREFLASTDGWFRPVNTATGPDGALIVVDFYRAFVEHPQYVRDEEARRNVDWREGSDRGRIWRVLPKGAKPHRPPRMSSLSSNELAALLEHPNGWVRDSAQRLLVERRAVDASVRLVEIALRSAVPQARVHAMRTLHGLDALEDVVLFQALGDSHPAVREHAVQLAEPRLLDSRKLTGLVTDLALDPDPRVRFQVACTLGSRSNETGSIAALTQIARDDIHDKWTRRAILTCGPNTALAVLEQLLADASSHQEAPGEDDLSFFAELAATCANKSGESDYVARALAVTDRHDGTAIAAWKLALWLGLIEGFQSTDSTQVHETATSLLGSSPKAGERIRNSIEHALRLASDTMQPPHIRSLGIRLLAHLSWPRSRDLVREILGQPNSPDLQIAAVRSLRSHPNDALEVVFTAWPTMSPPVRRAAIDVMLTRKDRAARLVEKLRAKDIDPSDIDPAESERLLSTCSDGERAELQSLFVRSDIADRQNAVDSYRAAITMQGNHDRGGSLFRRHCMTCHAIQGQGQRVGPDLASVAGRPRERLLVDILDPSREVGSESYNLVVATKDGRVLSGLLASENDRGITLRRAEGIEESISRDHIVQLRSTGKSLMPDGFERTLGAQEVADLLEFIARGEPPQSPQ